MTVSSQPEAPQSQPDPSTPTPARAGLVETHSGVCRLADTLQDAVNQGMLVGIDTEFHAERRYKPELMLVQLALPDGRAWVVDPFKVSLQPLAAPLAQATWVAHGAALDLQILYQDLGIKPADLWDTQIMAGMLGQPFPARLGLLVETFLGKKIDKGSALTDWSQRPLKSEQLRYAVEDATVVLRLQSAIAETQPERLDWSRLAGQNLIKESTQNKNPNQMWLDWDVAPELEEQTRKVLHTLFHWREEQAAKKGQPTHYVLAPGAALDIARRRPATLEALKESRRLPTGLVRKRGKHLVQLVARALADPNPAPTGASTAVRRTATILETWAVVMGGTIGVHPQLLLPRHAAMRAAQGQPLAEWRELALRESLDDFLGGKTSISMHAGTPVLTPNQRSSS